MIHIYLYWIKHLPYEYRKEKKPMDLVVENNTAQPRSES